MTAHKQGKTYNAFSPGGSKAVSGSETVAFREDKEGMYVGYSLDLCFYGGKEV